MHYFDQYGWYTGTPMAGREADVAPDNTSETTTTGELRANWTGYEWVEVAYKAPLPDVPTPSVVQVPAAVTMRQARLALLGAGLLDDIDAAINALPSQQKEAARIEWEYSAEVQRHNGFVSVLAPLLGLTDAQTDALFVAAKGL